MPLRFQWHPFTYSRFEDRNVLFNCGGYKILNAVRSSKKKKKKKKKKLISLLSSYLEDSSTWQYLSPASKLLLHY